MLKTFLAFVALAVIVDAIAFDGFYRDTTVGTSLTIGHNIMSMDWRLSH